MKLNHWRQHEPILMEFESAWHKDPPPVLADFLVGVTVDDRTALLAELVMIDFEYRLQRESAANLDSYFEDFPELCGDLSVRNELLSHEFLLRKSAGKSPTETELANRFSGDSTIVELSDRIGAQSDASLDSLLTPDTLAGPYRIVRRVGKGAFASVYSAVDTQLQREVALKFLTASDLRSASRMRLRREAQAVATLRHPNVVAVYGAGNFRGHDYIVTRLVNGISMDQWMKDDPPAVRDAVEIVAQLAAALQHAHNAGIIHRDIKPANVMIEDDVPLLLDFGLAHLVNNSQQLTHEGDLVGTPAFMPPEQADGRGWQADPRSDIYGLGAVLYRLIFRRLPFEGTTTEIINQVISREPIIPRDSNSNVNRDLQTIILKCLQKEPSHRYQTADDLRADLQSYLDEKPIVARPIGVFGRLLKWSRRRPVVAALLAGVVMLTAFGGGVATQLRQVTAERDRAQDAEKETQFLLARSAADAGRLAMQRGKLKSAVQHFEQALERGYPDRAEILLSLVEANFALRQLDDSAQFLSEAGIDPLSGNHLPALTMWRAELALETQSEMENGEQLFEQAGAMQLAPADEHYVKGVLAESSIAAVKSFRTATEIDPYHYRSRRMLVFLLLSLARVEETDLQLRIARQLYPDDQDFLLLDGLALAAGGDLETASGLVQTSTLDDPSKEKWAKFCARIYEISHERLFVPDNAGETLGWLDRLSQQFQREFLPLFRERKWRFPPRISRRFEAFTAQLPGLLTEGAQPSADALEQLVAVHPEASLFLTLGSLRLVDVSAEIIDREREISLLEKSRDDFKLSLKYPGFMKQSRQRSWVSVFTTSMTLALVYRHDSEENTKQFSEASRNIDYQTVNTFAQIRALFIASITANDLDESDRWMKRWLEIPTQSDQQDIDVIWHQAILFQRHKDWLAVQSNCKDILEFDPNHASALSLYDHAMLNISQALEGKRTKNENSDSDSTGNDQPE